MYHITMHKRFRLLTAAAGIGLLATLAVSTGPAQAVPSKSDGTSVAASATVPTVLVIDEKGTAKAVSASSLSTADVPLITAASSFPRNGYGSSVKRIGSSKRFDVTVDGRSSSVRRTNLTKVSAIQFAGGNLEQQNIADKVEMRVYVDGVMKEDTDVKNVRSNISQIQWTPPGVHNDKDGKGIEVWVAYRNRANKKWYTSTSAFKS